MIEREVSGKINDARVEVERGVAKPRRTHPQRRVARKAKAFARHHQHGVEPAARVFVVDDTNETGAVKSVHGPYPSGGPGAVTPAP